MADDVRVTRRDRFAQLHRDRFGGNAAAMGRALGKEPAYIRFRLNPERSGGRWIGERLAREIEEKLQLPSRWLDGHEAAPDGSSFLDQLIDLQSRYADLDATERGMVDTYLKHHSSLSGAFSGNKPKQ